MQRPILTFFAVFISIFCSAQSESIVQNEEGGNQIQLIPGQTLSLEVINDNGPISFATAGDYGEAKVIPGYYRLVVKAPPVPWVVTAIVQDLYSTDAPTTTMENVANLVSLRCGGTNSNISLSTTTPHAVVWSNNTMEENQYTLDLTFAPPFNIPPGNYMMIIHFQLQLQ